MSKASAAVWQRRKLATVARLFPYFERLGLHVTANHFYGPVPDLRFLRRDIFERRSDLIGVEVNEAGQLELLARIDAFRGETATFSEQEISGAHPPRYYYRNPQFGPVDAEVLYAMIRIYRPRRIVEIGSGYSTLVMAQAIRTNAQNDSSYSCDLTCVEPYPADFLYRVPEITHLVRASIQDQPTSLIGNLGVDDLLFIDSSHVLKLGSDVQYEYLELIPRVAPGVRIHIHDVYFPTEYPEVFLREWKLFWTEQYLVQCFLQFNNAFRMDWSSSWMFYFHSHEIYSRFPILGEVYNRPSSLWLHRVDP